MEVNVELTIDWKGLSEAVFFYNNLQYTRIQGKVHTWREWC